MKVTACAVRTHAPLPRPARHPGNSPINRLRIGPPLRALLAITLSAHVATAQPLDRTPSSVAGFITLSSETTISGTPAAPGQTLFLGDRIDVGNGAAEIVSGRGTKVILGGSTSVSFAREGGGLTALLDHGNLTLSTSQGGAFSVRTGNVFIQSANESDARAVVTLTPRFLDVATAEGSVVVEADGEQLNVPKGTGVRLLPDPAQGATSGPPQQIPAGGPVQWVLCGLVGAAVGSIPVIVRSLGVSSDPGWTWSLIPVGGVVGALLCPKVFALPAKKPPPTCKLTANGTEVVGFAKEKEESRKKGAPQEDFTIAWTLPAGVKGTLECDYGVGSVEQPVSGTGETSLNGLLQKNKVPKAIGIQMVQSCQVKVNGKPMCEVALRYLKLDRNPKSLPDDGACSTGPTRRGWFLFYYGDISPNAGTSAPCSDCHRADANAQTFAGKQPNGKPVIPLFGGGAETPNNVGRLKKRLINGMTRYMGNGETGLAAKYPNVSDADLRDLLAYIQCLQAEYKKNGNKPVGPGIP